MRREFRAMHGIDENAFVALAVGKLSTLKRPQDVLQAVEAICRNPTALRPVHIVFAGNGALFGALSAEAKSKKLPATFLGFVNVDKLPTAYCSADILVHPSEQDAHPLVCSESASIGLPMILSDRVGAIGLTDIARQGQNTIVYPCGNIPALVQALSSLAGDPIAVSGMGSASRRIFDELDMRRSVQGALAALDYCYRQQRQ